MVDRTIDIDSLASLPRFVAATQSLTSDGPLDRKDSTWWVTAISMHVAKAFSNRKNVFSAVNSPTGHRRLGRRQSVSPG